MCFCRQSVLKMTKNFLHVRNPIFLCCTDECMINGNSTNNREWRNYQLLKLANWTAEWQSVPLLASNLKLLVITYLFPWNKKRNQAKFFVSFEPEKVLIFTSFRSRIRILLVLLLPYFCWFKCRCWICRLPFYAN